MGAMPTYYEAMCAGAGGAGDETEDAEVMNTPGRGTMSGGQDGDGSRGAWSADTLGTGRGKGRGDSSRSGDARRCENWNEDDQGGAQYFQLTSGSSGGEQSGTDWESGSSSSWWGGHCNENWTWSHRSSWPNYYASNWEWVQQPDP